MRKIIWIQVAAMLVISLLVLTVSCQKKTVALQNEPMATTIEDDTVKPAEEENVDSAAKLQESESDKMTEVVMQENIYFEFDKSILSKQSGIWVPFAPFDRHLPPTNPTPHGTSHASQRHCRRLQSAISAQAVPDARLLPGRCEVFLVDEGDVQRM